MRYSGIGGQAVIEGVMMRNGDKYAVAVRKPDKEIEVKTDNFHSATEKNAFFRIPFIRGIVVFIESLYIGIKALNFSSSFYDDETDEKDKEKSTKGDNAMTAAVVALSLAFAVFLFMIVPFLLSRLFGRIITSDIWLTVIEGVIRLAVLIGYMVAISKVEDIKRTYMYHGAEHKCINCIENGLPLTVANVKNQTRRHRRCGTSFLLYVVVLSIILFMFIRVDNGVLRLVIRLLLVPVIAGIVYEFIRVAGRSENKVILALAEPGLWLQGLTTKEPDDDMILVGIKSVEAVFDWKAFLADTPSGTAVKAKAKKTQKAKKAAATRAVTAVEKSGLTGAEGGKPEIASKAPERNELDDALWHGFDGAKLLDDNVVRSDSGHAVKHATSAAAADRRRKAPVKRPTMAEPVVEDDDEILNALDRFFNSKNADEIKKNGGIK